MSKWCLPAIALGALCTVASAARADDFKLGLIMPLTGNTAWGGKPATAAAQMAVEQVNAQHLAGKFQIQLTAVDGACDPRTTYAAAQNLVSNGTQAIIGEWCSSATIAAAQVANDAQVPMIIQSSTADDIPKNAGKYIFRTIMANTEIQDQEANLLLQKFQFKTAAIVVENDDFGLSFAKNFRAIFGKAGIKILLDVAQDRSDSNWYPVITRLQGSKPDIVVTSIAASQAAVFVKQYAESNLTIPLFSDYTPPPYTFEEQVGAQAGKIGLVRGTFFLSHPGETAAQKTFVDTFEPYVKAKLGAHHTDHWDVATYDAVMVLADALKRSGSANPDDIAKALAATDYRGVLAHYAFDANRDAKPAGFKFLFIKDTPSGDLTVLD